ncbi:MAG: type III secretion system chaperone [Candidatus Thorarchaeota archaeon]|nr:type III secretion system chaperone [Candidatus Thorarchaeota archaeon]
MSTTWFLAKEYLKRLEVEFEEKEKKTFSLFPHGPTKTEEIEVFPEASWITLTTRLHDLSKTPLKSRRTIYETLLKTNASLVGVSFGVDKKSYIVLTNAIPITGISYDAFSAIYEAHMTGIKFFHNKLFPLISPKE